MFWSASASSFCRHEIKIILRLLTRTRLPWPLISHSFSLHYHWFTFPSLLIKRSTSIRWTAKKSCQEIQLIRSTIKNLNINPGVWVKALNHLKIWLRPSQGYTELHTISSHIQRVEMDGVTLPSLKQKLRHSQNSDRSTSKMLNLNWRGFWFYSRSWFRCGLHGVYDFTIFSNLRRRWWTRLSLIVDLGSLRVF